LNDILDHHHTARLSSGIKFKELPSGEFLVKDFYDWIPQEEWGLEEGEMANLEAYE